MKLDKNPFLKYRFSLKNLTKDLWVLKFFLGVFKFYLRVLKILFKSFIIFIFI